ncbi:MAG TPA: ABC transporter transmembrane domain-containing protein [Bryobacteraceae bacterium]|nr:ABC transporter transmembrane domain-containing protein [Bryobacteraceae bacterium]
MKELRRLLAYSRPYVPHLTASVLLMICVGAAQGLTALLIGPIFDRVLNPQSADAPVLLFTIPVWNRPVYLGELVPVPVHNVWTLVAISIVTVFLVKGLCDYGGNYLINYVGFSAVTDLRQAVFDRVLHQDANFFENNSTARVMSSIMNDLEKIQVAMSHILADCLRQSFTTLFLLAVVLHADWKLAIVSLTVLPFVLVPTVRLGRRIRRTTRSAQDDAAELNQVLQETLSGNQVVKSFGAEEIESNRFRVRAQRLRRSNLHYVSQQAIASPLIEFFGALTIVALLFYARMQIKDGSMTAGEFTSFVIALLMLYEPVKRLTGIHNIFQQALGASQKVFEYLDRDQQIKERAGAVKLVRFEKAIQFEDVSFRYPTAPDGFTLDSIRLEVKAGEIVALVGPSGAGKTTLANLVPRFYDVQKGAVKIDGRDVRDLRLASLREKIGMVAQDTFLFNDTVANNIGYGLADATREQIREAARLALAEEFIQRMPDGYDTMIGERGQKLSGGQRQRLAIARALLKNAPILILDEATSHLDSESEMLVQRALQNLMEHRTVIVIAHRLSTVRRADQIVVLDRGQVCEMGRHEELVNRGGVYQRLYELQFLERDSVVNP